MAAMLEDLGHTVFEVLSAQEALVILGQENSVQLVLTDLAMPRMTGLELIVEIKTAWPNLPVILATGFAELPPGTDPPQVTLAKPFLQYDLEQAVEAAISGLRIPRAGRFRSVKAV
jgi:CheY-like chemotaxis protein